MQHRLWYISLVLEAACLGALAWKQQCPMLMAWLAFDILTGIVNAWIDQFDPSMYQISWEAKQLGAVLTRILAAREVWKKLGGRPWIWGCMIVSGLIYIGRAQAWPHSIIDAEFAMIAVISATLAFCLFWTIASARKLTTNPFTWNMAHVMAGHFLLSGLIYYVASGARENIGKGTGIVAVATYGIMAAIILMQRKGHDQTA